MQANLERFDVYRGIIVKTTRHGAVIRLLNTEIEAFSFCSANLGDRVLVSISKIENNRVRCKIDSFDYSAA